MATKKQDYSKYTNSQKMALLKKQQADYNKKFKNMTPAQKKAKLVGDAKKIGLTAAQVASMVGGVGLARKAAVKGAAKVALKANNRLQRQIRGVKQEERALKAANTPTKNKVASQARARGAEYQKSVDAKLTYKDKGVRQRTKINMVRKGPGWIGGNSYIKVSKKK